MDRDQQADPELAGDRGALLERQRAILVAGQRHPHPAMLGEQIAKLAGESEGEVLFLDRARHARRAGVAAAVAGVDQHDRPAGHPGFGDLHLADLVAQRHRQPAAARLAE